MCRPGKIKLRLRHLRRPLKRIDRGAQKVGSVRRILRVIGYLADSNESARREITGRKTATQLFGGGGGLIPPTAKTLRLGGKIKPFFAGSPRGRWDAYQSPRQP